MKICNNIKLIKSIRRCNLSLAKLPVILPLRSHSNISSSYCSFNRLKHMRLVLLGVGCKESLSPRESTAFRIESRSRAWQEVGSVFELDLYRFGTLLNACCTSSGSSRYPSQSQGVSNQFSSRFVARPPASNYAAGWLKGNEAKNCIRWGRNVNIVRKCPIKRWIFKAVFVRRRIMLGHTPLARALGLETAVVLLIHRRMNI